MSTGGRIVATCQGAGCTVVLYLLPSQHWHAPRLYDVLPNFRCSHVRARLQSRVRALRWIYTATLQHRTHYSSTVTPSRQTLLYDHYYTTRTVSATIASKYHECLLPNASNTKRAATAVTPSLATRDTGGWRIPVQCCAHIHRISPLIQLCSLGRETSDRATAVGRRFHPNITYPRARRVSVGNVKDLRSLS